MAERRCWPGPCIRSPAMPGELPHARRLAPRRGGLPHAARALSRRPGGLRRDLPRAPGRRGPHLGGPLHDPRRPRAQGLHAPRARRRHRHRRADVAGPARGRAVGHRGLLAAPALRPRRPRPGRRLRGPVPPARRPPAAACASTTSQLPGPPRLDADDGRGPRRHAASTASARPRPRSSTPRRRSTRAGYRVHALDLPGFGGSSKPARRPVLGALVRRHRRRGHGRAGHRPRPPGRQLDGRPRGDRGRAARARARRRPRRCSRPPWRSSSATATRSCACCARSSACCPTASAAAASRASSGACSPTPTRSTPAWPTSSSTSSSASTPAPARGWPSSPRRATSTSNAPSAAAASTRAWPSSRRPSLFVWGARDRLIPPGFKRHVAQWLPDAEQIVLEDCGHVPQVERSEQTNGLLRRFFDARRRARPAPRPGARGLGER